MRFFTGLSFFVLGLFIASDASRAQNCVRWEQRPALGPAARWGSAMAFDSDRGVVVLFGGQDGGILFGETWEWDGAAWSFRVGAGPAPGYGDAMTYDTVRQSMMLFVSNLPSGARETWSLDGAGWTLRAIGGPPPYSSNGHGLTFDSNRGVAVLVLPNHQTWEWDGADWQKRTAVPSAIPPNNTMVAVAFDAARAKTVALLYRNFMNPALQETWEWDGSSWAPVSATGPLPARDRYSMTYDALRQRVVLFGGNVEGAGIGLADTWAFDGSAWIQALGAGPAGPAPRMDHAMAYDAVRDRVVVFGGRPNSMGAPASFDDTWEFGNVGAPHVLVEPADASASLGAAASFSVEASGNATLTYHWRRNGVPLMNGGSITGATTPTLTINPALPAHTGTYEVVLTNGCRTITSASATLMVVNPCFGDTNGDYIVNFADLNTVLSNFGAHCAP